MPELPEVETVRRQLEPVLTNRTISGVEVFHAKTVAHDPTIEDRLVGQTIATIERVGKLLIFSFKDAPDLFLLAHLKMTGQFFFVTPDNAPRGGGHSVAAQDIAELPGRHTRTAFYFTDGSALYFNDMRLFGYTKLATAAEAAIARAGFGPEPNDPHFDHDWFVKTLRRRRTPVKAALLDQSFVAGLGNIYVDEALFRARIRPGRQAARVSTRAAYALAAAAQDVLREAIAVGGTTFQHFVDTGGNTGNFTDYLQVFGKQNTPCPICGTAIKKVRLAGRGTHYCPTCQS